MNIYIIVENPKRELDSRIYLALMLIRMGYKVYIVKKTRLFEKLDIIDPGVLFLRVLDLDTRDILTKLKNIITL